MAVLLAGTQTHNEWLLKTPYPLFPFGESVLPWFLSGAPRVQGPVRVVFCSLCCESAGGALGKVDRGGWILWHADCELTIK